MPSSRTPWKKSRTFGDIYGGRQRRRMTDNIFNRLHSLTPPGPLDERPLVLEDNPSRDFVFPVTGQQVLERLRSFPAPDTEDITHIWLRRVPTRSYAGLPFADLIAGSGVTVIVIYPWASDLLVRFGPTRPTSKILKSFAPWTTDLRKVDRQWCLAWDREAMERYTLDHVLPEMVGQHVAWQRDPWVGQGRRKEGARASARAASYAAQWSAAGITQHEAS
jgi:hypothetical protein